MSKSTEITALRNAAVVAETSTNKRTSSSRGPRHPVFARRTDRFPVFHIPTPISPAER